MAIYLDSAATTYPRYANTLQPHWINANAGYSARYKEDLKKAEDSVKASLGVKSGKVIFGGNASQLFEHLRYVMERLPYETDHNCTVIMSPYEHECVGMGYIANIDELQSAERIEDIAWIRPEIDEMFEYTTKRVVMCQYVNNITGDIFDVRSIGEATHEAGGYFVCDMTASIGKADLPKYIEDWCDCIVVSSHKFHGAKNQGFMWVSDQFNEWLNDIDYVGTPDVTGAIDSAFAFAQTAYKYSHRYLLDLNYKLVTRLAKAGIKYETIVLRGAKDDSDKIICLKLDDITSADALQSYLADKGIYIGVGHSSCEDGKNRFRVLMAGTRLTEEECAKCIRISYDGGINPTTEEEIDVLVEEIKNFIDEYCVKENNNAEGN